MKFHFVTLFPDVIQLWLQTSIIGRANKNSLFEFATYQLRDFSCDKHRSVDDVAYGGGGGMVLRIEPLVHCLNFIKKNSVRNLKVIYLGPQGKQINVSSVNGFAKDMSEIDLVLICGHYEGIDERFIEHYVDEVVSVGDFIVSGGELPALLLADAIIRKLPGTLDKRENSTQEESFSITSPNTGKKLLEYPHYTRPSEFNGWRVPEILLSGNHAEIHKWRLAQSVLRTKKIRPDLEK